jgi:hypothetical protein
LALPKYVKSFEVQNMSLLRRQQICQQGSAPFDAAYLQLVEWSAEPGGVLSSGASVAGLHQCLLSNANDIDSVRANAPCIRRGWSVRQFCILRLVENLFRLSSQLPIRKHID